MEPIKKLSPEEYAKEIKAKYVNLYRNHLSKMRLVTVWNKRAMINTILEYIFQ